MLKMQPWQKDVQRGSLSRGDGGYRVREKGSGFSSKTKFGFGRQIEKRPESNNFVERMPCD